MVFVSFAGKSKLGDPSAEAVEVDAAKEHGMNANKTGPLGSAVGRIDDGVANLDGTIKFLGKLHGGRGGTGRWSAGSFVGSCCSGWFVGVVVLLPCGGR